MNAPIQQGNLQSLSSGKKLEQGKYVTTLSYINAAHSNHPTESHTRAKSLSEHPGKAVAQSPPWGATLGALDLIADDSFSGASILFISQPGAVVPGLLFFFFIITYYFESEGWWLCALRRKCFIFCCFMMWPSCYVTRDMGVLLRLSRGYGRHSEAPGHGLMSAFYILGAEPQACSHVVFHGLPLSRTYFSTNACTHR